MKRLKRKIKDVELLIAQLGDKMQREPTSDKLKEWYITLQDELVLLKLALSGAPYEDTQ